MDPRIYAYKPVARKVRPVPATYPEEARTIRKFPEDPLLSLQPLSPFPPDFIPTLKLTEDRLKVLNINSDNFLWPEEVKLLIQVFKQNEKVLAFDETERGTLRQDYFSDYIIPTIEHVPWAAKPIPVPPGLRDNVIKIIKSKINAGVFEPSQASYRAASFFVKKKDGGPRHVVDLQPLNAITIRDSGIPPAIDSFVEPFAASSVYSSFDLYSGYDHRILHPKSRDLTSFHTPLGLLRCCVLPMGYTNAVSEFQNCTVFILQHEIPDHVAVMIDDLGIKGPPTRYELSNNSYETIPENSGIRRFIWEHALVVNRVLHRLAHAGATISPKKSQVAKPEIILVGQKLTYEGRLPDDSRVSKIKKWPTPMNLTEVRAFLGLCGTMRIWIQDYSLYARPLTELVRKGTAFQWNERRQEAMDFLKEAIINSPALIPIDYSSSNPVILAVDTSVIAIGYIIYQEDSRSKRKPVRFGSLPINDRESRYSQAKLELYGLYRTLRQTRYHLTGVKNLIVEVDAKYIKDMLNHPDLMPNATLNRWIAGILLFDFTLKHVPAGQHKGPDGLSRRPRAIDDSDEEFMENDEDSSWFIQASYISQFIGPDFIPLNVHQSAISRERWTLQLSTSPENSDAHIRQIKEFLLNLKIPSELSEGMRRKFLSNAANYFIKNGKLWKRTPKEFKPPSLVVFDPEQKIRIMRLAHDELGHRGVYATAKTVTNRFWWPNYFKDITNYVKTCHTCQIRSTEKLHIPITISTPVSVFSKVYLDVMHMPKAQGYHYIVAARDNLTGAAEGRKLRSATSHAVANFIFEELLCRYGQIQEIVTDNGPEVKGAVESLLKRYNIHQIRISPYNSAANGVVERGHFTIREALIKSCKGNINKWPDYVSHAFFADKVTTRRSTGFSPYYLLFGTDPTLPLDLFEATYLVSGFTDNMTTDELLSLRIRQLQKLPEDIDQAAELLKKTRLRSKRQFEKKFGRRLIRSDYQPNDLVLVRNTQIEKELNRKSKPRYIGPFKVIRKTQGGSYILSELDGTISKRGIAAFRLRMYYPRLDDILNMDKLPRDAFISDTSDDEAAKGIKGTDWGQSEFKRTVDVTHAKSISTNRT